MFHHRPSAVPGREQRARKAGGEGREASWLLLLGRTAPEMDVPGG